MEKSWKEVGNNLETSWKQVGKKLGKSWKHVGNKLGKSGNNGGNNYNKVGNNRVKIHQVYYMTPRQMWRFYGYYGGLNVVGDFHNYGQSNDSTSYVVIIRN